jgi:hypothetical protein
LLVSKLSSKRDLLLLRLSAQRILVVACDSSGGIGPKSGDSLKVPAKTVGKYLARTVLLELLCAGAEPLAFTCALSLEYEPTGKEILAGVIEELKQLTFEPPIAWSTEKNFKVNTTGVGATAVGITSESSLRIRSSKPDDSVILLGRASVGADVIEAEDEGSIPTLKEVRSIMNSNIVHEVLPIGSTGILHETQVLSEDSGLVFDGFVSSKELQVSGGPSTALLLTLPEQRIDDLKERLHRPFRIIGILR